MEDHNNSGRADTPVFRRIPPDPLPPEALPAGFSYLRLWMKPGNVCIELTRPDMILGRHSSADLRVPLPDISRRHCRFVFADGHWEIVDLNSLNGIFINGERLQKSILRDGDEIALSSIHLVVMLGTPASREEAENQETSYSDTILKAIVDRIPFSNPEERGDYRKAS